MDTRTESPSTPPDRPLRVLLWSPVGAGLHYSGPAMTAYRLYATAAPKRFLIDLAHGQPQQQRYELFQRQHLVSPLGGSHLSKLRFVLAGRRWIRRHAGEYEVFHGLQGFSLTVSPALAAQKTGLPAVIKLATHRSDLADKASWSSWLGLARRRRRAVARLSGVIAISRAIEQELLEYGIPESKVVFIPNGVDVNLFRPPRDDQEKTALRRGLGWADRPTVLFVGRLVRRKGPLLMLEAMARLKERAVDAQLVLVGPDGEADYMQQLRDAHARLGLGERVIWHGFTEDPSELYRAADVFALPSRSEGMPNAVAEALASGLPAVVTAISGSTDLIGEEQSRGRFIERDAASLSEALGDYLSDASLRQAQGEAARRWIVSHYSTAAVLDAHEALFRRIIAGQPARD